MESSFATFCVLHRASTILLMLNFLVFCYENPVWCHFFKIQSLVAQNSIFLYFTKQQNAKQVVFVISCSFKIFFYTGKLKTNISGTLLVSLAQFLFVYGFSVNPKINDKFVVCLCVSNGSLKLEHVLTVGLTFWRRTFFQISAHPVFKMCVIQKPNKVALWNKRHFEEKKI